MTDSLGRILIVEDEEALSLLLRYNLEAEGYRYTRIANPTTAAQYFHLLRRQARLLQTDPLPLIVLIFGLGFMLGSSFGAANPPRAFGHAGAKCLAFSRCPQRRQPGAAQLAADPARAVQGAEG